MIKAIIFDCFGVLTTQGFGVFQLKYFDESSPERLQSRRLMTDLNSGRIPYSIFLKRIAKLSKTSEEVVRGYLNENTPNEPLFDFMRHQLKSKYKLGLLSNAGDNWLKEIFRKEDVDLFDEIILSYKIGIVKPNPEIYLLAAQNLNAEPRECVFIDDSAGHCRAAGDVGMKAIWYQGFEQMKNDLVETLK